MTDHVKEVMDSIYDWHLNDDKKIVAPKSILPECIKERIRYFMPQMDDGLTFKGCLEFVLATKDDEEKLSKDYAKFAYYDWLPVSDEVDKFLNYPTGRLATAQVAFVMLFGYGEEENYQVKYGDYYFNTLRMLTRDSYDNTYFSKEGAERAAQLLKPKYFITNVRFCNSSQGTVYHRYIKPDTQIPEKYNNPDYVFLFQIGKHAIGMNAEEIELGQPECVHFNDAVKILKSIQNIKPKIIKGSAEVTA